MSFAVAADADDRFMGGWADALAAQFVAALDVRPGLRALDVGAGTGALTRHLFERLGAAAVAAIEPSEPFVAALTRRVPGVDVRRAEAADLPFVAAAVDLVLAQLVVHFLPDPVAGIREMARVGAPGGLVAVSVWDFAGGRSPVSAYWRAAAEVDPGAADESVLPGAADGELARILAAAGLRDVVGGEINHGDPAVLRAGGVVRAVQARCRPCRCAPCRPRAGGPGGGPATEPRAARAGRPPHHDRGDRDRTGRPHLLTPLRSRTRRLRRVSGRA